MKKIDENRQQKILQLETIGCKQLAQCVLQFENNDQFTNVHCIELGTLH